MAYNINQNPEQIAGDRIEQMLTDADRLVQSENKLDLSANQSVAIENPEHLLKQQTKSIDTDGYGAEKTITAAIFIYRLLKPADAKRILFLVDAKKSGATLPPIVRYVFLLYSVCILF